MRAVLLGRGRKESRSIEEEEGKRAEMLRKREGPPADPGLGFWANVGLTFQAIIVLCAKRCVAFAVFSAPPHPPPHPSPPGILWSYQLRQERLELSNCPSCNSSPL